MKVLKKNILNVVHIQLMCYIAKLIFDIIYKVQLSLGPKRFDNGE